MMMPKMEQLSRIKRLIDMSVKTTIGGILRIRNGAQGMVEVDR